MKNKFVQIIYTFLRRSSLWVKKLWLSLFKKNCLYTSEKEKQFYRSSWVLSEQKKITCYSNFEHGSFKVKINIFIVICVSQSCLWNLNDVFCICTFLLKTTTGNKNVTTNKLRCLFFNKLCIKSNVDKYYLKYSIE